MPRTRFEKFLWELVQAQVRRPWLFLGAAVALALPAYILARGLDLHTGFDALLPENKPSVVELRRVSARTPGVSSLAVVIDGTDRNALQRFSDALVPELRALGPDWVGSAENGIHATRDFVEPRQALSLSVEQLTRIRDRIEETFGRQIFGSVLDDDEEEEAPPTRDAIMKEIDAERAKHKKGGPPFPDGYNMNEAGTRLIVMVRTPIPGGDLTGSRALANKVQAVIQKLEPSSFHPSLRTGLTGDLITSKEQYGVIRNDLVHVGIAGVAMILAIDFIFFLKLRAVLTMALAIGTGVLYTFAATRLLIGHLNTASGFLVSIIFGNGINFGILLRARYGEARRAHADVTQALFLSYRDTLIPTLSVSIAAGTGYASLAATDFRGFRDFGVIGGIGMLLCWVANYWLMPPLLALFDRLSPERTGQSVPGWRGRLLRFVDRGIPFGVPFSLLVGRIPPKLMVGVALLLGVTSTAAAVRYIARDPLEYRLSNLENDDSAVESAANRLGRGMTKITGRVGQDGMAIMTDRLDQVKPLLAELEKRRLASGQPPAFDRVVSIFDFIPDQQPEKLALLAEIRSRLTRAHELGKLPAKDWEELSRYLPPKDLTPFGIDDLPERMARPFTERDGTRGRIVYIVPTEGQSVKDLRYLLRWADSYRVVTLPNGEVIHGSGRSVIFADMLSAVITESPRAVSLAGLFTLLVVILTFARSKHGWLSAGLVLTGFGIGIAGLGASLYLFDIKLNFLNFIAIPITFGIGVDYAVNLVHRWRISEPGQLVTIVRETGGAVILCSLTTILGYLALLQSVNPAVRSFGLVAVLGELTCLLSVVLLLPAFLLLAERWRKPAPQPS